MRANDILNTARLSALWFIVCSTPLFGQGVTKVEPHIGYLYPAGIRRSDSVFVEIGGQYLRNATAVHISGDGVSGRIISHCRPFRAVDPTQRKAVQKHLRELIQQRLSKVSPSKTIEISASENDPTESLEMPNHALLRNLEEKSLHELVHAQTVLFAPRTRKQINRQIEESLIVEIKADGNIGCGNRELRIETANGLTNPMVFQVGKLREIGELEPNDREAFQTSTLLSKSPRPDPIVLPILLNGQILPGDIDRFRFRAEGGQGIVIEVQARSLIPYLADAVPGWFQAAITLYDNDGNEIAFADDHRFNPDPVLYFEIPETGEYEIEIRDAIYRGREDFIYRIAVGELPYVTHLFPLGAAEGSAVRAEVTGWNLPRKHVHLETTAAGKAIRTVSLETDQAVSNAIPYAVDPLPESIESESNNEPSRADTITLPGIVNGRIGAAADVDVYRFRGKAGRVISARVQARVQARVLHSPLDSYLLLTDAAGHTLASNDDYVLKASHLHKDMHGLQTHHADSYLLATLPKDGDFFLQVTDSQHHGGEAYGYRLQVKTLQGDFALRVTPSSLNMRAGGITMLSLHVMRKEGFEGEIEVGLVDDSAGFELTGNMIPAGCDHIRMTLRAPNDAPEGPVNLKLAGRALIGESVMTREALPAEDMMQAFLYRHLVPSQELLVVVKQQRWRVPPVKLRDPAPVVIRPGEERQVVFNTTRGGRQKNQIKMQLLHAPEGVTLEKSEPVPRGFRLTLRAADDLTEGIADNLIIEAYTETRPKATQGKSTKTRRVSLGLFPAIPVVVDAKRL